MDKSGSVLGCAVIGGIMERLKILLNNIVVVVLLAALATVSIITAIVINVNAAAIKDTVAETYSTEDTVADNTDATQPSEQKHIDYKEKQASDLDSLTIELSRLSNPKSAITDIIDRYIEVRYNYSGTPDKDRILNALSNITRKTFLGTVDNSLTYLTGDSKAEVIKRYASQNSTTSSVEQGEIDSFIYIVNINGENRIIEYTMIKESKGWVLYAEEEIGTISNEDIETKELTTPDVTSTIQAE